MPAAETAWQPLARVAFRFAFCYLGLYSLITLSNVEDLLPYEKLWHGIVPWVGAHILHLSRPITYFPSGSGDKTSDWVLLLCHLVISIAATALWTVLDRRKEYATLNEWLRVLLRFAVAWTMVVYGSVKVVKLQFHDPTLGQLIEPWRDFSPMGMLWKFMGSSTAYTFFAGACELAGGALLFFRRTTTLGALVSGADMTNVAMLNYAYDTPVKLLSTHLVLMCGYLLIPDLRGLYDFFVQNRPAAPAPVRPHFASRKWRIAEGIAKTLFLGYVAVTSGIGMVEGAKQIGSGAAKSPVYGIWEVEEFTRDGVALPPLLTDTMRWRRLVADFPGFLSIQKMDDSVTGYKVKIDKGSSMIVGNNLNVGLSLKWERPDADHLLLTGTAGFQPVSIRLKKMDVSHSNLLGRGFHWVSELPFNR